MTKYFFLNYKFGDHIKYMVKNKVGITFTKQEYNLTRWNSLYSCKTNNYTYTSVRSESVIDNFVDKIDLIE